MAKILCADVRMTENYYLSAENFQFPYNIHVFYGKDDPFLLNCDMEHWSAYTQGNCRVIAYEVQLRKVNSQEARFTESSQLR